MAWAIPAVLTVAFFIVFRRSGALRRVPHELAAIGAAAIVMASSAYELATALPGSVRARVYAALLGAMVVVVVVAGTRQMRRT